MDILKVFWLRYFNRKRYMDFKEKRKCDQTLKKGSWNWKDFLLTNCDVSNISIPSIQSTLINIFVKKLILHFTTKLFPLVKQKSSNMVSKYCWGAGKTEFEMIKGCTESIKNFHFVSSSFWSYEMQFYRIAKWEI